MIYVWLAYCLEFKDMSRCFDSHKAACDYIESCIGAYTWDIRHIDYHQY